MDSTFASASRKSGEGLDHLLGVAAGVELGFFEQAEAAREVVDHFLAAGLKFNLAAAAQFLERGAFAFQFVLRALEFGELLLRLDHLRSTSSRVGARSGSVSDAPGGFVRLKIGVDEFRCVVGSHAAT